MKSTLNKSENEFYLKGIRENDFQVLNKLYKQFLPKIISMVKKNSGSVNEAKDVFQEAIVVIFKKAGETDFKLTTSFYNYLHSVSRYIWLRQLNKKHRKEVTFDEVNGYTNEHNIEQHLIENEQKALFKEHLSLLSNECRAVLEYYFDGKSLKEIAKIMSYTEQYSKRKKYKCKEHLLKKIKEDIRFTELKSR